MLEWEDGGTFREVLAHPKLIPYYHLLLGEGYRMDHLPLLISQVDGSEGFCLHGGPIKGDHEPNFFLQYDVKGGVIRNSLLAVAVQLTDVAAGDGGFAVLRGSHKANFRTPESIVHGQEYQDRLFQPQTEAGDVVLFSEATVHGTLPWTSVKERRALLYRFAPANMAYGKSYMVGGSWPEGMVDKMDDPQRAVLEGPYNSRLDRPHLRIKKNEEVSTPAHHPPSPVHHPRYGRR